jgi:hypothetical protein
LFEGGLWRIWLANLQSYLVESLYGRFREECLNEHVFWSLPHVRRIADGPTV